MTHYPTIDVVLDRDGLDAFLLRDMHVAESDLENVKGDYLQRYYDLVAGVYPRSVVTVTADDAGPNTVLANGAPMYWRESLFILEDLGARIFVDMAWLVITPEPGQTTLFSEA